MAIYHLLEIQEDAIPQLELINEECTAEFLSTLYWWYKEQVDQYFSDPPNIDNLLDDETVPPNYLENVFDAVARTIISEGNWESLEREVGYTDEAKRYEVAYDIINSNWEEYMSDLRKDIKTVFDSLQIFYADGLVTWDYLGNADWSAEKFYHSPLQEVW